jgi:hypothetical protein
MQPFKKQRQPLKKRRNELVAFVLAYLFGAIGVGIYLRSWRDAGVALLIGLAGIPVAMLLPSSFAVSSAAVGAYALMRVRDSNAQLTASEGVGVLATS